MWVESNRDMVRVIGYLFFIALFDMAIGMVMGAVWVVDEGGLGFAANIGIFVVLLLLNFHYFRWMFNQPPFYGTYIQEWGEN